MIPLDIVGYENFEIDMEITKYVNKNIEDVIRVLLDFIEDDPEFDISFFFPRDYLERKPEECRRILYELYDAIKSPTLRDYLKPKYEYSLYAILQWWKDVVDSEDELLINKLNDSLIENIKKVYPKDDAEYIIKAISDFDEYEYICFADFDFLQINDLVTLYLKNSKIVKMFFQYDDLDDFIELMDCDLRERYLDERRLIKSKRQMSIEENIITELINVFKNIQKRVVEYKKRSETEITADIHDQLNRVLFVKNGIHISREFTMGRASKSIGETDLYFYMVNNDSLIDIAILENKNIEKFKNQYNQLMGYLNPYFKFGITISINRNKSMNEGYNFIMEKLKELKGTEFEPINIGKIGMNDDYIMFSEHIVPENGKRMKVYHMILQLYDKERKKVAVRARNKQI